MQLHPSVALSCSSKVKYPVELIKVIMYSPNYKGNLDVSDTFILLKIVIKYHE